MNLIQALSGACISPIAIVGAGGKTSFMLELARQSGPLVIISTTTHIGKSQVDRADRSLTITDVNDWEKSTFPDAGIVAITGLEEDDLRVRGPGIKTLEQIAAYSISKNIPLLIEADGSRGLPVKAPAYHEPAIPDFAKSVVVVAGISAIGQPIRDAAHRPDDYSRLANAGLDEQITPEQIARVLTHEEGGLKRIPPGAARIAVINQADTDINAAIAGRIAGMAVNSGKFELSLVTGFHRPVDDHVRAVFRSTAGVVLAAGEARRFGRLKQLLELDGETLVHRSARIALESGLNPVVVVVGAQAESVAAAVADLPVVIARNELWSGGPGTSIRAGIRAVVTEAPRCGAVLFLMADQPYVDGALIRRMVEEQALTAKTVIAPMVEGRRVSPVLFARSTFDELYRLEDAASGRAIFPRHPPHMLPWLDSRLALDIDTPDDWRIATHE